MRFDVAEYLAEMVWDVAGDLSFGEPLLDSNRGECAAYPLVAVS